MPTMALRRETSEAIWNIFRYFYNLIRKCICLSGYGRIFGTTLFVTASVGVERGVWAAEPKPGPILRSTHRSSHVCHERGGGLG